MRRQCHRLISLLIPSSLLAFSTSPFSSSSPSHLCTSDTTYYTGWAESKEEAEAEFYSAADWGYLDALRAESSSLCTRSKEESLTSSIFCTSHLQACKANNIMMDFSGLETRVRRENLRYSTDIFRPGQLVVSGCDLNTSFLMDHATASFPLQSWGPELRHLVEKEEGMQCDETIDTPTLMVKLDATSNMYHHFCDFFNIFISLNLNNSVVPEPTGRQVLILDNHPYHSSFRPAWKSVTDLPLLNLNSVAGKRICFKDLLLPLLPRMVYGLYYGTPLIPGCHSSSMFSAFSAWFSSALGLALPSPNPQSLLQLTLLSRATKYRQILNEQEIVKALSDEGYQVTVAKFTPLVPFQEQLETIRNTDILVGIHGAGLTHLLFLPDWAHVLELYNCEDPGCYKDLARLRGVGYSTWTAEDLLTQVPGDQTDPNAKGPAHKKFSNYVFDVEETLRIVKEAGEKVLVAKKKIYQKKTFNDEL